MQKKKSSIKKWVVRGVIGMILLLVAGGLATFRLYDLSLGSVVCGKADRNAEKGILINLVGGKCLDASRKITKSFVIASGDSVRQISENLSRDGLIRNSSSFQMYVRIHGLSGQLKAGSYNINNSLSVREIVKIFLAGSSKSEVFSFTILPGETISSIKKRLGEIGYKTEEVESAFKADYRHPVLIDKPDTMSLEGYLFGDTYEFYKNAKVEDIIKTSLDALEKVLNSENLVATYRENGLNLHQAITLASIVQKEAKTPDMPGVAQVFLLRKRLGIALGSDVTVQYALDQVDPHRKKYTNNAEALKIDSQYNTRMHPGLPPGPISNPGKSALLAVAHPTEATYLYFLTGDDGKMYYGYTEEDHRRNINQYCKVLCSKSL